MARSKFCLSEKVYSILRSEPEKQFKSIEIAQRIFEKFPKDCAAKKQRSKTVLNDQDLIQQIAREWGAHWRRAVANNNSLRAVETRPRRFYYTDRTESSEAGTETVEQKERDSGTSDFSDARIMEHDLYPAVGSFLFNSLSCLSMRINEARSSNKNGPGGNKWLFPDIVGIIDLTSNWDSKVKNLATDIGADHLRLLSFEVKLTVNRSNVREVVFQTVSNSSWANQAYLVANTLDSSAADELRLLCLAHNIGFIELNYEDPSESQIIIPAKLREDINFESLSRLVEENTDAQSYMENISNLLKIRRKNWNVDWDLVPRDMSED